MDPNKRHGAIRCNRLDQHSARVGKVQNGAGVEALAEYPTDLVVVAVHWALERIEDELNDVVHIDGRSIGREIVDGDGDFFGGGEAIRQLLFSQLANFRDPAGPVLSSHLKGQRSAFDDELYRKGNLVHAKSITPTRASPKSPSIDPFGRCIVRVAR